MGMLCTVQTLYCLWRYPKPFHLQALLPMTQAVTYTWAWRMISCGLQAAMFPISGMIELISPAMVKLNTNSHLFFFFFLGNVTVPLEPRHTLTAINLVRVTLTSTALRKCPALRVWLSLTARWLAGYLFTFLCGDGWFAAMYNSFVCMQQWLVKSTNSRVFYIIRFSMIRLSSMFCAHILHSFFYFH